MQIPLEANLLQSYLAGNWMHCPHRESLFFLICIQSQSIGNVHAEARIKEDVF